LLTLAGLGARGLPGTTRSARLSITLDMLQGIRIGLAIAFIVLLVWLLSRGRGGERQRRGGVVRRFRWLPLILAGVLVAILAYTIPRSMRPVASDDEVGAPQSQTRFEPLPAEDVGSIWVVIALTAVITLTVAGFVLLVRRPAEEEAAEPGEEGVAAALAEAIDELEWSNDPRSVVIKAYVDIERVLALQGLPRWPSEAPREYLMRVLSSFDVGLANIERLTTLFEVARFSIHQVDDIDAAEAMSVMEAVRSELAGVTT